MDPGGKTEGKRAKGRQAVIKVWGKGATSATGQGWWGPLETIQPKRTAQSRVSQSRLPRARFCTSSCQWCRSKPEV